MILNFLKKHPDSTFTILSVAAAFLIVITMTDCANTAKCYEKYFNNEFHQSVLEYAIFIPKYKSFHSELNKYNNLRADFVIYVFSYVQLFIVFYYTIIFLFFRKYYRDSMDNFMRENNDIIKDNFYYSLPIFSIIFIYMSFFIGIGADEESIFHDNILNSNIYFYKPILFTIVMMQTIHYSYFIVPYIRRRKRIPPA